MRGHTRIRRINDHGGSRHQSPAGRKGRRSAAAERSRGRHRRHPAHKGHLRHCVARAVLHIHADDAGVGVQLFPARGAGAVHSRRRCAHRAHRKGQTRRALPLGVRAGHLRRDIPLLPHLGRGLIRQTAVVEPRAAARTRRHGGAVRLPPQIPERQGAQRRCVRGALPHDRDDGHIRPLHEPASPPRGGQAVGGA